jgi:rubrerythrin
MKRLFGGRPVLEFREESSRRNFIKGAALVGVGTTYVALTSRDSTAFAQGSASDLEILNYALTLEYLEAEFYMRGLEGSLLSGRTRELVEPILDHENAHVTAITQTVQQLGGTPVEKPMFMFPEGTFTDQTMFLTAASMFEELGVDAYHGQIGNIQSPEILGAAAAIAGVESRHAAILADLTGGSPFPAPFENSKPMEEVLAAAGQFIQA